jgi:membrane protease YdiL (CAAX protease family)
LAVGNESSNHLQLTKTMTTFQITALSITAVWILLVVVRFRRSTVVLIAGLFLVAAYTVFSLATGAVTFAELGLSPPRSWWVTIGIAVFWTGVMYAYSPVADWIASQFYEKPPTLEAFRAIQESMLKLVAGIAIAWLLGGILEELLFRGVVLQSVDALLSAAGIGGFAATGLAIIIAAVGAGLCHLYQGERAAVIITQLSVLFGVLFVFSGYNLWAVMLAHGFYDTIAFIRFAMKKSKYSNLDGGASSKA